MRLTSDSLDPCTPAEKQLADDLDRAYWAGCEDTERWVWPRGITLGVALALAVQIVVAIWKAQ